MFKDIWEWIKSFFEKQLVLKTMVYYTSTDSYSRVLIPAHVLESFGYKNCQVFRRYLHTRNPDMCCIGPVNDNIGVRRYRNNLHIRTKLTPNIDVQVIQVPGAKTFLVEERKNFEQDYQVCNNVVSTVAH